MTETVFQRQLHRTFIRSVLIHSRQNQQVFSCSRSASLKVELTKTGLSSSSHTMPMPMMLSGTWLLPLAFLATHSLLCSVYSLLKIVVFEESPGCIQQNILGAILHTAVMPSGQEPGYRSDSYDLEHIEQGQLDSQDSICNNTVGCRNT